MKFLCVACDEAMTLNDTQGPNEGSMTVIFGCPSCGREVAMLTNPMETQMVRSLGVKIGGRTGPTQPMEMVRTSLAYQRTDAVESEPVDPPQEAASKCPFTSTVAEAYQPPPSTAPRWTAEAEARIARIPSYARPMVRQGIEQYAREQGYTEIGDGVMDEVRGRFGM